MYLQLANQISDLSVPCQLPNLPVDLEILTPDPLELLHCHAQASYAACSLHARLLMH